MQKEIASIQQLSDSIKGFLSQNGRNMREGEVLYHLARKCSYSGVIAEIGSWMGKSTLWLGKGAGHSQSRVYAIDHHVGSEEHQKGGVKVWTFDTFKENMVRAGLESRVTPVLQPSQKGAEEIKEALDLLFIDGAHDYASVKADFELYFPKVKVGGVIAFHDSFVGWPGVNRLVHTQVFRSKRFAKVRYIDSITYATVTERATLAERLANHWALFVKRVHEKTLRFPQPFKSLIKHLTWGPCRKRWMRELMAEDAPQRSQR